MKKTFFSSTIYESNPERIVYNENFADYTVVFKVINGFNLKEQNIIKDTLKIITYKRDSNKFDTETRVNSYTLHNEYSFNKIVYHNEDEIKVSIKYRT